MASKELVIHYNELILMSFDTIHLFPVCCPVWMLPAPTTWRSERWGTMLCPHHSVVSTLVFPSWDEWLPPNFHPTSTSRIGLSPPTRTRMWRTERQACWQMVTRSPPKRKHLISVMRSFCPLHIGILCLQFVLYFEGVIELDLAHCRKKKLKRLESSAILISADWGTITQWPSCIFLPQFIVLE